MDKSISSDELRRRVLSIVGDSKQESSSADFARYYHDSFQGSGISKAQSIIGDLQSRRSHLELEKCAYFSIGGSAGDEVEHVLRHTKMKHGLLLEYDDYAVGIAHKKAERLRADLQKNLAVVAGDAMQKIADCKHRLLDWRRDYGISGLIVSAQAVLHELPTRSPNFDLVHFLGEVLWEWNPCVIYAREPCAPEGWPPIVRLTVPGLSSEELERIARYIGKFLKIDGEPRRAGPRDVLLPSILAVELLHKLFYVESFRHEIEEQLTSISSQFLVEAIESYLGPGSVQRIYLNTDSFARLYKELKIEARAESGAKRLSPPLAFVAIVGERRMYKQEVHLSDSPRIPSFPISTSVDEKKIDLSDSVLNQYLDALIDWSERLLCPAADKVDDGQNHSLSLPKVHVPLATREKVATCEDHDGVHHRILPCEIDTKGAKINCVDNWRLASMLALETVPYYSRVILTGRPGSGKTTTLRYLTHAVARRYHVGDANKRNDGQGFVRLPDAMVPVRLSLKDVHLKREKDNYVKEIFSELDLDNALGELLRNLATKGSVLFLMDDIDVISTNSGPDVETGIISLIEKFPNCPWLLTAQNLAWGFDRSRLSKWFRPIPLAPLSKDGQRDLIRLWWLAFRPDSSSSETERMVVGVESAIDKFGLTRIASSPEILSGLVSIYARGDGDFPRSSPALYRNILKVIESRWNNECANLRPSEMSEQNAKKEPANMVTSSLSRVAANVAYSALKDGGLPGGPFLPALLYSSVQEVGSADLSGRGALNQFLEVDSGLITRSADDEILFTNRGVQEFLAASEICTRPDFPSIGADLVRNNSSRWRSVFVMAAGLAGADWGIAAVRALCPFAPPSDVNCSISEEAWKTASIAGEALAEIGLEAADSRPERRETLERIRDWLVRLIEQGALSIHERHEVGMTLSKIGDPRPGVCTEVPEFCFVQKGPVMLGGDNFSDGTPYEFVIPYDFWVSKYPVTNAQYARYVEDNPEAPLPDDEANVWSKHRRVPDPSYANHPVVGVSYMAASAYCTWLSERLRRHGVLEDGYEIRLPRESEWMKVYRGGIILSDGKPNPQPARRFPWGMDWMPNRANLPDEKPALSQTTSVGLYPNGITPTGVLDAAGNVLEWTTTCWGSDPSVVRFGHPYNPDDGREDPDSKGLRILRGGSWLFSEGAARCACRLNPDRAFPDTGFRVFKSSTRKSGRA